MHYIATADTDVGNVKKINQDSLLIKHGICRFGEVLLAIVCDGMGGLAKGELASAEVIRALNRWFDQKLINTLETGGLDGVVTEWSALLKSLNETIGSYGDLYHVNMGTTFTGVLFVNDQFISLHVGDTRLYYIGSHLEQLTNDQTFVAREVARGNMTPEQAKTDPRRNVLLQCIGASAMIEPQILRGQVQEGVYLLCSDGFRHENSENEIFCTFQRERMDSKEKMHLEGIRMIEQAKARNERDNISILLVRASRER